MRKVLVTGGNGFLGRHLCHRLLNDGHEVICLDKTRSSLCYSILHDITDPLPNIEVDEIYNLAGTPSPAKYASAPVQTIKTNTIGVVNVLNLATACGAKILQASTGEVYSSEDFMGPRACYRQGKRTAETIFFSYQQQYGIDVRVARMFNSYGPGMAIDDGRVIPVFVQQAIHNEDIYVFGNGMQTRSFCYVDDMINALVLLMAVGTPQPVDISGNALMSIVELAQTIIGISKSRSLVNVKNVSNDDYEQREPTRCSMQDLGWKPEVSFERGIERTIDDFRRRMYVAERS